MDADDKIQKYIYKAEWVLIIHRVCKLSMIVK